MENSTPSPEFDIKKHGKFLLLHFIAAVVACLWIYIHLSDVWWVAPAAFILGGIQFVFSLLAWLITDDENSKVRDFVRACLMPLMGWKSVIIFYSALAIVIGFFSSVTVTAPESTDLSIRVADSPEGLSAADYESVEHGTKRSFVRFIAPWGKTYHSDGACIQYQSFVIRPWLSTELTLESDPALLFRFAAAPSTFKDGRFVIEYDGQTTTIGKDLNNALVLGCRVTQDSDQWETDLLKEGYSEQTRAKFQSGWKKAKPYNLPTKLVVGKTIRVKFLTEETDRVKFDSEDIRVPQSLDTLLFEKNN